MKWEYDNIYWNAANINDKFADLQSKLYKKGEEGWELVTSNNLDYRSDEGNLNYTSGVLFVFKRPKEK